MLTERTRLPPANHSKPVGSYSPGIAIPLQGADRSIFVSGQVPTDAAGNVLCRSDAGGRTRVVFERIVSVLQEAGAGLKDLVSLTTYLRDLSQFAQVSSVCNEILGDTVPSSTLVEVSGLAEDGCLVEISAVSGAMKQVLEAASGTHLTDTLASAARTNRVLVVGAINYDELFLLPGKLRDDCAWHAGDKQILPGGHAGNCASALTQLGLETALLGAVGDDAFGHFLLDDLSARGVDTSLVRMSDQPTGRAIIPIFEDGHFMVLERGANDTLGEVPADLLEDFDAVALFDPPLAVLQQIAAHARRNAAAAPCYCTPSGHFSGHPQAGDIARDFRCLFLNTAEAERMNGHVPFSANPVEPG